MTVLRTRAGDIDLSRPRLMGILNVTPDSFSDGGDNLTPEAAIARAETMVEEGADLLDVGGESTRPGAPPVPLEEELRRVVPIVELLAERLPHIPVSVDTSKAEVARRCLESGASIINDVTALRGDTGMALVIREHDVPVVLMHMRGEPGTMQDHPVYADVVAEVAAFLAERADEALQSGASSVILDPGIGFGKTLEHNLLLLKNVAVFRALGHPVLIGASRKSFIGKLTARDGAVPGPGDRLEGSLAAQLWAVQAGASLLRVHDVKAARRALDVWSAVARGRPE